MLKRFLLLALAAIKGWSLTQLDVNNAVLYGDLFEDVYMQLLSKFQIKGEISIVSPIVYKLNKSLYG